MCREWHTKALFQRPVEAAVVDGLADVVALLKQRGALDLIYYPIPTGTRLQRSRSCSGKALEVGADRPGSVFDSPLLALD